MWCFKPKEDWDGRLSQELLRPDFEDCDFPKFAWVGLGGTEEEEEEESERHKVSIIFTNCHAAKLARRRRRSTHTNSFN